MRIFALVLFIVTLAYSITLIIIGKSTEQQIYKSTDQVLLQARETKTKQELEDSLRTLHLTLYAQPDIYGQPLFEDTKKTWGDEFDELWYSLESTSEYDFTGLASIRTRLANLPKPAKTIFWHHFFLYTIIACLLWFFLAIFGILYADKIMPEGKLKPHQRPIFH